MAWLQLLCRRNVGGRRARLSGVSARSTATTRLLSSSPAFDHSPYALVQGAEVMLDSIHQHTHLPWWLVIVGTTLALRGSMTLSLAVYQAKVAAKQELLLPRLKELQTTALHRVVAQSRRENLPHTEANKRFKKEAVRVAKTLFYEEGCHPYKLYLLPWVQIPLWITLSYALRNMTGFFSNLSPPFLAESPGSMAVEGTLWFGDLTAVDPYFILPVTLAATNLLIIELHNMSRKTAVVSRRRRIFTNMLRGISIAMCYIGTQLPSAVVLYWSLSSSAALMQNVMLMMPRVRRALHIPKVPSEREKPFRHLLETLYSRSKAFLELQRKNH